ncbi:hypothetical protein OH799_02225 [Nocardia sp. NBC_00881]|uniref:hypothetical protein n=1 Tax=Nocardia sp. NBC_00881 TaxID=2975995 RepID=UPI00386A976C|nr:hypothetical protein OH799_02225 [Nocardia sp. NBC_00881]
MPRGWDAPTLWAAEDLLKSLWDNVDHPWKPPGLRADDLDFSYGAGTVLRMAAFQRLDSPHRPPPESSTA